MTKTAMKPVSVDSLDAPVAPPEPLEPVAEPLVDIFIDPRKATIERTQEKDETGQSRYYLTGSVNGESFKLEMGKALRVPLRVARVVSAYLGSLK